jgi:deazaflavin-dependent oxidoreductase (nitroreductase family)
MADGGDWNAKIIHEFRANQGRVGGFFAGAPIMLVHHRGRKTGREFVTPVMYLPSDDDRDVMYIFATKQGAPDNPAWYYNLMNAGTADVEVGSDGFPVSVSELTGDERGRVYAEQARRYQNFGEYEQRTSGVRTIPVLALRRASEPRRDP